MKKFSTLGAAVAVIALALAAAPSFAQHGPPGAPNGPRNQRGGQRPDPLVRMSQELHLSQAQKTKLRGMMDSFRQQMSGMRGDPNAREKMRPMMDQFNQKVRSVLNPEQKKKFDKMGGLRGFRGGGGPQAMNANFDKLGLNASQKAKVHAIMQDWQKQSQAASNLNGDARRNKMRAISDSHRQQIMNVLTPAQRQKFTAMMPQRRGGQ